MGDWFGLRRLCLSRTPISRASANASSATPASATSGPQGYHNDTSNTRRAAEHPLCMSRAIVEVQMIPSHSQPPSKRKEVDDMNPLGNASKKLKKEVCIDLNTCWTRFSSPLPPCRNRRTSGSVSTLSPRSGFCQSDLSLATCSITDSVPELANRQMLCLNESIAVVFATRCPAGRISDIDTSFVWRG